MATFRLRVQTQAGSGEMSVDARTLRDAMATAQQQGAKVEGYDPAIFQQPTVSRETPHPGTPPSTGPFPGMGMLRAAAPTIGQVGLPMALGALGVANPLALGAAGIVGGLGGSAIRRGGAPTVGDVATTAAGELVPPLVRKGIQAGRAIAGPASLGRGFAGEAERLGVRLPAPTLFGREESAVGRLAERMAPKSLGEQQATAITKNVPARLRTLFGPIGGARVSGFRIKRSLSELVNAVPEETRKGLLASIKDETGINIPGLNAKTVRTALRENAGGLARAAQMAAEATGADPEAVTGQLAKAFWADTLENALVKAIPGKRQFPGAIRGSYLDGNAIVQAVTKLGEEDKAIFGNKRLDVDNLVAVLSRAQQAQKVLPGRAVVGGAKPGAETASRINITPFAIAIGLPFAGAAGGELIAEEMGQPRGRGALATAEAIGAGVLTAKGLATILSSPAGIRWFAAGVDAMNAGMTEKQLIPALARAVPHVLQEVMSSEPAEGTVRAPAAAPDLGFQ